MDRAADGWRVVHAGRLRTPPPLPETLKADWEAVFSMGCSERHRVLRPLVTGCGRSGTHAATAMLARAGLNAVHENGHLGDNTVFVSWPAAAYERSATYWRGWQCFAPIVKVHREPLNAISSIASGFNAHGVCGSGKRSATSSTTVNGSKVPDVSTANARPMDEAGWDAVSFQLANQVISLPLVNETNNFAQCCRLSRHERILLALNYWVGWNELADSVATHSVPIESLAADSFQSIWCAYCGASGNRCACDARSLSTNASSVAESRPDHNLSSTEVRGVPLTWQELYAIDATAAKQAAALARAYGYPGPWIAAADKRGRDERRRS